MKKLIVALLVSAAFVACSNITIPRAKNIPRPGNLRLYTDPGAPKFTVIKDNNITHKQLLNKEGDFVVGPKYTKAPEFKINPNVPQGVSKQFVLDSTNGSIYNPGVARTSRLKRDPNNPKTLIVKTKAIDFKRKITVYIPAQYKAGTEVPFMVSHDGPKREPRKYLSTIFDNLIAQKRIPTMIVISIANGGSDAQGSQRGKEYDTMSGLFAEYIETHVLPKVESNYNIKLTKDPNKRAVMGNSSGASAALCMAWYRPDLYRRVLSSSGTFVNQQWPFNPKTPDGAWGFHNKIINESSVKPIRIWLGVGDRDNLNPNVMRDDMHDWVEANHRMAKVLKAKGYHYQYLFCLDNGHSMWNAKNEYLPHAIEWLWKD